MYIQAVFAVKFRRAVIEKQWRPELMAVIGNLINETGCDTIIVNGVEDHVHCFFSLKPSISVSDVMKNAKSKSSKWVNDSGLLSDRFEWQGGFGTFSYSRSHIDRVYKYIENQERHHCKTTFRNEYIGLLEKHQIDYDDQYIFKGLM
ncbi:IS200/IS605 family transposase [Dyadobacter sp. CY326]|nr:IS200/IS605 family transposase [Dyadobacter sp. CY326]